MSNAPIAPGSSHSIILVENLSRGQIVQYAGASGDFNPLHTDEIYTTKVAGYQSVFAHGMLTMGMTGRAVTDLYGVRNLRRFGGRFRAQVWPGDTITAVVTVSSVSDDYLAQLSIVTRNQHGTVVFEGTAAVSVPQSTD
jgi:acyl dehydratase